MAIAAFAEYGSIVYLARLQRRLLATGGLRLSTGSSVALVFAGDAISLSLPGGGALSNAYSFRKFRERGADRALAAWALVGSSIASNLALVAIAAGGAEAAGLGGPAGALGIAAAGVVPFAGLVVLARHPSWFVQLAGRVLTLTNRLSGRPRGDAHVLVPEAYDQLGGIHPRRVDFAMVALLALLNWGTDILCLALAFRAVGGRAPWPGIFVAYAVGQLASSIPIVPGGLGIVEGGLAATLVAYGAAASTALAAVFVYRLISFWAVLVVGWVFWVIIMRRRAGRPARVARSLGVHGNDRRRLLEGLYGQQTRTDDSQA